MEHFSDRTKMMLGDGYDRLKGARVAVFGIGGVGGYAVEALARAGVGSLVLIDSDSVSVSNINRQIIATSDTVGRYKTEAARERIHAINPECEVQTHEKFFSAENKDEFDFSSFDYVIDAIDSLSSKIELIIAAKSQGTKIISAMGAGNKLDPTRFKVADISKTAVCPLARAVRIELRKRGINHLKVVYSDEPPCTLNSPHSEAAAEGTENCNTPPTNAGVTSDLTHEISAEGTENRNTPPSEKEKYDTRPETATEKQGAYQPDAPTKNKGITPTEKEKYDTRRAPGSLSFVPSVMGLILAGEVIKDIAGII